MGKSLLEWELDQLRRANLIDEIIVASDDSRIIREAERTGIRALRTARHHRNGTERVAEVAKRVKAGIFLNIQGDEPMIDPASVDRLIREAISKPLPCASLYIPTDDRIEIESRNTVKVVIDRNGDAIYFSRYPIPFVRDNEKLGQGNLPASVNKHLGVYLFTRQTLLHYSRLEPSYLEKCESLEQLRLIENGIKIRMVRALKDSIHIDTPGDLKRLEKMLISSATSPSPSARAKKRKRT